MYGSSYIYIYIHIPVVALGADNDWRAVSYSCVRCYTHTHIYIHIRYFSRPGPCGSGVVAWACLRASRTSALSGARLPARNRRNPKPLAMWV